MPREADFYTPGEAANMLGLTEFTVLGLLTSGQLEGHQDEEARWWIPAAAVDEAVRRSRDSDPLAGPSTEETIAMEPVSADPQDSVDTTTQSDASDTAGGNEAEDVADVRGDSGWVTTKVAAEALGVDPRTVRTYINRGELEAKVEREGVEKTYLVSIDSVYSLRDRRGLARKTRGNIRAKSVERVVGADGSEDLADMVRELTSELIRSSSEAADIRARLELTERAESSLREDLQRVREERQRHLEEAERLRAELEAERSKGFWQRLLGGERRSWSGARGTLRD
jgi:predicted site-specific integrase-resolvase